MRFVKNKKFLIAEIHASVTAFTTLAVITKFAIRARYAVAAKIAVVTFTAVHTFVKKFAFFAKRTVRAIARNPKPKTIITVFAHIVAHQKITILAVRVIRTIIGIFTAAV